jgi:TonB family protein
LSAILAIIGGVLATLAVFVAIPISQKLNDLFQKDPAYMPEEVTVDPPETQLDEPAPPPEEPEEETPEEMAEEAPALDMALDLGDLTTGTGGGFLMEIPKFSLKSQDDPLGSGDLDNPPTPVSKPPPVYPGSLLGKGVGGKVTITCTVDASGRVTAARVKQSSGHAELDRAAIDAVNRWKFKPGTKAGKPATSTCVVPFSFEVKKP